MGDSKVPCPGLCGTPRKRIASSSDARGEVCRGREFSYLLFRSNLSDIDCNKEADSDNDSAQTKSMDELRHGQHPATAVMEREASALELPYERCPCQGEERCDS